MRLITLLITVVALAVAAPAIADKGGTANGGNGGGGGGGGDTPTATATPTPTPTPDTTASSSTASNGKKAEGSSPSISIATVNGTAMDTSRQSAPAHGSAVTFDTTSGSIAGWEYPMVELSCYQDVNGDQTVDTNLFGSDLVYVQLKHPDRTFTVSGGDWTAGTATCHARLMAYGSKAGQQSIRPLASTYDWTAAW